MFFIVSSSRPIQSISCNGRLSVTCPRLEIMFPCELLVKEPISKYIGRPLDVFGFFLFQCFLFFFGYLQTSLLYKLWELAGGGSAAVVVGVSDKWQVTCEKWHMSCNMWHVKCDTWPLTYDFTFGSFVSVLILVLVSVCRIFFIKASEIALWLGAYYNGPKFKYRLLSGTGWFSYKIWTKNSKTPMVNLLKNLRPFQNYDFKIQWETHFFTFF